jgi:hypothetical protein
VSTDNFDWALVSHPSGSLDPERTQHNRLNKSL